MTDARSLVISALEQASSSDATVEIFKGLRAGSDMNLDGLGLDSLSRFEVIMQLEEELEIELDEDELIDQHSVFGLADYITKLTSKA